MSQHAALLENIIAPPCINKLHTKVIPESDIEFIAKKTNK